MKKLALILAFAATTASAYTAHPCVRVAEMAPIVINLKNAGERWETISAHLGNSGSGRANSLIMEVKEHAYYSWGNLPRSQVLTFAYNHCRSVFYKHTGIQE